MRDDAPDVEPLIQPLTRPPTYFGVDIIVFVVNGIFGIVIFIASSNFLAPLVVLPIHFIALYLCQRDIHIVRVRDFDEEFYQQAAPPGEAPPAGAEAAPGILPAGGWVMRPIRLRPAFWAAPMTRATSP